MKKLLIALTLTTLSLSTYARNCVVNDRGEVDWKTVCDLDGRAFMVKQCKQVKVQGSTPGTFKLESHPKKFGWSRGSVMDSECDITIHECKALAEKMLAEYESKDECGQEITLKKVKFTFKVLNEIDLKFKTIHKETVRN